MWWTCRRDSVDHLRHLGHHGAGPDTGAGATGSIAAYPGRCSKTRRRAGHQSQRRPRARDNDPADHHRDQPRHVFDRTPRQNVEAAWALGSTRWEMIRSAVLPYGQPGVIAGSMLGLGRALGETIAITLILYPSRASDRRSRSRSSTAASIRLQDREQRGRVQQPHADWGVARRPAWCCSFSRLPAVNAAARSMVTRRKEFA